MAVPPLYKNLGKQAKDLLSKDYEKNLPSLKVETKAENEVTFTFDGRINSKTGEFVIDPFQYKYDLVDRGLSLVAKATSNRKLTGEITFIDKLAKGLRVTTSMSTTLITKPDQIADNALKIGMEYARENIAATSDFELVKRVANLTGVVGNKSIAVGGEVEVNLVDTSPSKYDVVGSYTAGNFVVTASLRNKLQTLGSSFYRRINDNTSVGGEFSYKLNSSDVSFIVGGQQKLDKDTSIKGKVDSKGVVSLSYIQNLRKNVRAVFSTEIDALNLSKADAHKVGIGITLTDE